MLGLDGRKNLPPQDAFLALNAFRIGTGYGIVLAGKTANEKRVVWDRLLIHKSDVHIGIAGAAAKVMAVAREGVLPFSAGFPLVGVDGMPWGVFRIFRGCFKPQTKTANAGKEFTYGFLHKKSSYPKVLS